MMQIRLAKPVLVSLFSSLAVFIAVFIAFHFTPLGQFEWRSYDARMRWLGRFTDKRPRDVVLFLVDEASLRRMQEDGISWPWPRELYSMVLDFAGRGGARGVVFDLLFSEDSTYGLEDDRKFSVGLKQGPPSYLAVFLSKSETKEDYGDIISRSLVPFSGHLDFLKEEKSIISLPIEEIREGARHFGNVQSPPDADGVYRGIYLIENLNGVPFPSLPLKVFSDLFGIKEIRVSSKDKLFIDGKDVRLEDGKVLLRYYPDDKDFEVHSLADVIVSDFQLAQGKEPPLNPSVVSNKVVVVGVSAPGLYDLKPTPLSARYAGPKIHATAIQNLIDWDFISPISPTLKLLLLAIPTFLVSLCIALSGSAFLIALSIIVVSLLVVILGAASFYFGVFLPLLEPIVSVGVASASMLLYRYFLEGKKKREIRRAFAQYLSPEVVEIISKDPSYLKLGGEEKEISILFSDIANFTSISERTRPDELVSMLNEYFLKMTHIIHNYNGTLDKYIGDAIMAFWGAPIWDDRHALGAVFAALDIARYSKEASGFLTRVGVHTGLAIVGNIGSEIRFNYTAIGDPVNLASRLEGLNKKFGTQAIISGETYKKVEGEIIARRLGKVRVKGRETEVDIYEPICRVGEAFDEVLVSRFVEALTLFEKGDLSASLRQFELLADRGDDASRYYVGECRLRLASPKRPMDSVIVFDEK